MSNVEFGAPFAPQPPTQEAQAQPAPGRKRGARRQAAAPKPRAATKKKTAKPVPARRPAVRNQRSVAPSNPTSVLGLAIHVVSGMEATASKVLATIVGIFEANPPTVRKAVMQALGKLFP